jgi:MoxR-like ATPase
MFSTPEKTLAALENVGYLTDVKTATTVYYAARLNKPILIEGPAGAGKTELADSVAKAGGMRFIRLQCYEGITDKQAIGDYNRAMQQLYVELKGKTTTGSDWDQIKEEIASRDFYMAGPLLEAIEAERRCVLLIDELDKVDHAFEALLLEILSAWQLSVPGLGTVPARSIPFVVLTSNQERILGNPLRRRSLYLQVEHPTPEREAAIVARCTPNCSPATHAFIAGFAQALRGYNLEKPPSISEMNDIAQALELLGYTEIEAEHKDIILPLIAKTEGDRNRLLMKQSFESIINVAKLYVDRLAIVKSGVLADFVPSFKDDPCRTAAPGVPAADTLADKLIGECRKLDPLASAERIIWVIRRLTPWISAHAKNQNPLDLLERTLPKAFEAQLWREQQAHSTADPTNATPMAPAPVHGGANVMAQRAGA